MRIFIILIVILFVSSGLCFASIHGEVRMGNKYYDEGEYDEAVESYKKALNKLEDSDIINFNAGTAFYKKGDYVQTIDYLQKVLLSEEESLRQSAYYNLGNTFYQSGIAKEEDDLNFAIQSLEQSLKQYKKALEIAEEDADAKHNYKFVKKELERLKKKAQNQQSKTCPRPQQKEQDKDSQDQQQQDQNQDQPQDKEDQQQNQDKQEKKDNQENQQDEDQERQQEDPEDSSDKDQQQPPQGEAPSPSGQPEMTEKEAKALLDHYQQGEEPKGLLNLDPKKKKKTPVDKDW